ncbi:MAG: TolC family protein [Bacteroidetes bacterium]|nr:TolC family protein [Bacteroidota bacterium]
MKMNRLYKILTLLVGIVMFQQAWSQGALTLSGALGMAMENNYGLIISRAGTEIAAINNNPGNAGRYPTIGFDASENNNYDLRSDTYSSRFSAGVGLNWVLFDGFRVNITKAKLGNLESLSAGRLGVVIESTIEDVILGYYGVLLQQEQLKVLQTIMELSNDRYQYELDRKSLGGSVTYNVLQAQNVYLTDKANYMNQEVVVRNSVRNLNFLMGESPTTTWNFSEPFEADTTEYRLADLLSKMKASNQTLKNQYTNLLLLGNETSLKRANYSPTLSLGTGVDLSESLSVTVDQPTNNNGSLSPYGNLRLSYDIYSAGVRRRSLEVARINEELAQVEISEMEHALTNELFNLADYYGVRVELLNVANENMEAAELNLSISEEKYRSGVINSFNYRDVQLIYLNAALRRLRAVYNLIDSRTQLTRITGGFLGTEAK